MTAEALIEWTTLAERIDHALHLATPAIGITFADEVPDGIALFDDPIPAAGPAGLTGRVPAGCVFWFKASDRTFATVAADHANCSVGAYTHGFSTFDEMAAQPDVATLIEVGWVTPDLAAALPHVETMPASVVYGPLAETPIRPDVVLLRINARQLMVINDALGGVRLEGKPQCHIVALARAGEIVVSTGCAASRIRTQMPSSQLTCAAPAARFAAFVDAVEATDNVDDAVMNYAAEDALRFM